MKKGGGSEATIIIGRSKSVLVYALHSLEYVLGLARFRVLVPKLLFLLLLLLLTPLSTALHQTFLHLLLMETFAYTLANSATNTVCLHIKL